MKILIAILTFCVLAASGCATTKHAMTLAAKTLDNWKGDVTITDPLRIEVGGGVRNEYYGYAQISGVKATGKAEGSVKTDEVD